MPKEMKDQYRPHTTHEKVAYLIEECGELLAALGKSLRWGLDSVNPELPVQDQETNQEWVLREIDDVERALNLVRDVLR